MIKCISVLHPEIEIQISQLMFKTAGGWECGQPGCGYVANKWSLRNHIESKHISIGGIQCDQCSKSAQLAMLWQCIWKEIIHFENKLTTLTIFCVKYSLYFSSGSRNWEPDFPTYDQNWKWMALWPTWMWLCKKFQSLC